MHVVNPPSAEEPSFNGSLMLLVAGHDEAGGGGGGGVIPIEDGQLSEGPSRKLPSCNFYIE
jgi:hypothetical protein